MWINTVVEGWKNDLFPAENLKNNSITTSYGHRPIVCPLIRERLDKSGDIGISTSELKEKYGERLDYVDMEQQEYPEIWWYDADGVPEGGEKAIRRESIQETKVRVQKFYAWLSRRPEKCIAVVGHSAYIKMLTSMSRKLNNCEIKRYEIDGEALNVNDIPIATDVADDK